MSREDRDRIRYTSSGVVPGVIVVGLGVLFLLNNLRIVRIYEWWLLWPVVLIGIGLQKLIDSQRGNDRAGGAIMVVLGGVFLSTNLGWLPGRIWEWWPLILIGAGIMMLLNRWDSRFIAGRQARPENSTKADAVAIFGGFKRQFTGDDFRGASYVAIFGGGEIDLRRAQMQVDVAVIEVSAIFGGFEVKVPTNWLVVNEVTGIFGGTGDETLAPSPDAPGTKRLVMRGTAVFGGVGIKN
jgi:hypothetical protein